MPFVTSEHLEDMIDPGAAVACCRRITDRAGDELLENTRRNTPIDRSPLRDKPGRPRGTARASLYRTPVEVTPAGRRYRVWVRTNDPVFPHIEWNTEPHNIPNAFGFGLDFGTRGKFSGKFHPGTTGQHPFALGALKTSVEIGRVAAPAVSRFRRDLPRSWRVDARAS